MPSLKELLRSPQISLEVVTKHLDGLAHADRVEQVTDLGRKAQEKLWKLAESSRPLTLDFVVPPDAPPLQYFPFEGRNSLPTFTRFQKVFYRDLEGNVCGYNNAWIGWLVGPGYYLTQMNPKAPEYEIQVDYTRIPTVHPQGWPAIKSNDIFPTMFVYGGTRDNLRWVSKDVLIGRAFKMGEDPMPNWFVLCRQTPAPEEGVK